jgi:outer membrane biosynthesis protein TonB
MPIFRTKLKQLRDADVRFISLVDRAATRIPFRVLKREKESEMGIDLTRVFKSDGEAPKPFVSAVVVFAQKDEAAAKQVLDAIEKHGFRTDRVQKSDGGETLVFAQTDQPKDVQLVRLSDQVLVSVANFQTPSGWIGDQIDEHGFFPDLKMASQGLHEEVMKVSKSDTPQDHAQAALTSYAEYLNQMIMLPVEAFKLDEAVTEIVKKCSCEAPKEEPVKEEPKKEEKVAGEKMTGNPAKKVIKESEEDRKKRIKDHPPSEMAPVDEEDDQKPPPEEEAKKNDNAILAALNDLKTTTTAQLTALTTKLETVVTEQGNQKKVLDDVVKKADTLGEKLGATVVAPVVSEDRPAGPARMRVQKDDDPRTGNFDTAFLRRRK